MMIVPNIEASSFRLLFCLSIVSAFLSGVYTYFMSGGLPSRTQEELLSQLRDGVDASLMCPHCNIVQSRAVHCNVCNTCVADPNC